MRVSLPMENELALSSFYFLNMFYYGNNLFSNSQLKNDSIWRSVGVKEVGFLLLLFDF